MLKQRRGPWAALGSGKTKTHLGQNKGAWAEGDKEACPWVWVVCREVRPARTGGYGCSQHGECLSGGPRSAGLAGRTRRGGA